MTIYLRVILAMHMIILSSCSSLPAPTPPLPTIPVTMTPRSPLIVENAGQVCFYTFDALSGKLTGEFRPSGCYSSSCTQIIEQGVTPLVNEEEATLRIDSRFVLLDTHVFSPEPKVCTADCEGGGVALVVFEHLLGTQYRVMLGAESVGDLALSKLSDASQPVCLGKRW